MDVFQIINKIKSFLILIKDFFISFNWQEILSVLKTILGVVSVLLFVGIIYLIIRLNFISRAKEIRRVLITPGSFPRKMAKKWNKIEKRLKSNQEAELKLAVIEADKFFDDILKKIGYLGKDMGERLKKINPGQMANINDIWNAHKIRNNIVHDIDYKLNEFEAERAIDAYKKALEELEVI